LRLFACACCRRAWNVIKDEACRQAVTMAEQFADGLIGRAELAATRDAAMNVVIRTLGCFRGEVADTLNIAARTAADAWAAAFAVTDLPFRAAMNDRKGRKQADLLRHIFGNPFQPPSHALSQEWTADAVDLARALYAGEECHFALHDALQEVGDTDLALHFLAPGHPKGCWALDLILAQNEAGDASLPTAPIPPAGNGCHGERVSDHFSGPRPPGRGRTTAARRASAPVGQPRVQR
jgi:hypothetical protein